MSTAILTSLDRLRLRGLRRQGFTSHLTRTSHGPVHHLELQGPGTGPPALLLHGLGSCAVDYERLMRGLRHYHRRIIAPDLPGHGFSPMPAVGMDPDALSGALLEVVDAVVHEPSVVYGNSLGGMAAVRFAAQRPHLARALVLASPGGAPMPDPELAAFFAGFRIQTYAEALAFADRFLGRPNRMRLPFAWGVRARMASPPIQELLGRVRERHMLQEAELQGLSAPVMLFWGVGDEVLPARVRDFFRTHLPPHTFVYEPEGYGHAPYLDSTRGFIEAVQAWLQEASLAA